MSRNTKNRDDVRSENTLPSILNLNVLNGIQIKNVALAVRYKRKTNVPAFTK